MLDSELKSRKHDSALCATWDIDIPDLQNYGEVDLIYVVTPVLFSGTAFELGTRLVTLQKWSESAILINPLSTLLKATKAHFTARCVSLGIPHPKTLITENPRKALNFALDLFNKGKMVVIKPVARGEGVGVRLLKPADPDTMLRYLLWYSSEYGNRVFYLQEFVENLGFDLRIFVIDGQVVGRMKRIKGSDFRYNLACGGGSEPFIGSEYDALAVRSAEAMGAKVAGVDIMPTRDTAVVVEVNIHPGFRGLVAATGIPIPKLLVDYFELLTSR
ncbi:MAG: hypothetical protein QXI32_00015 [Candidatus Bathyarchaeia archaeon]